MEKQEIPEYLYHYTTIETLALILKNKTIRFNNLNNVDDLGEGQTLEEFNIKAHIYISSWTTESNESIPLWNLYTHNMQGVRIKLPSLFFCKNKSLIGENDIPEMMHQPIYSGESHTVLCISPDILFPVKYEESPKRVEAMIEIAENILLNTQEIGKVKSKCWSFQKEWRYKFYTFPLDKNNMEAYSCNTYINKVEEDILCKEDGIRQYYGSSKIRPATFYDIKINDEKFEMMEITMGPKVTLGQELIIETLLEKYNSIALKSLNKSELNIR